MFISAHELADGQRIEADVCIVGTGAAGSTLALQLAGQGLEVVVVESGAKTEDSATQALYKGHVVDALLHSPTDKYRQRRLGGSTTTWGGRCMPFDPLDFEARPQVPDSGWPITFNEIACHYPMASQLVEAGRCEFNADRLTGVVAPPLFKGFSSERVLQSSLERFSCPTNFGDRYGRRLEVAQDVRVLLNANCVEVLLAPDGTVATGVLLATLGGKKFTVQARCTVLATGGLETPRLLLASRRVQRQGIGNAHDIVGRYYMCHIAGNTGRLQVQMPLADVYHGYFFSADGVYCRRRLALTPQEQQRIGAGNVVARLHFPTIADPSHRDGVLSGLYLAKGLISYEYGKRLNDGVNRGWPDVARHLLNVMTDPLDTSRFLLHWLRARTLARRKFPSVILKNKTNTFSLEVHGEQIPLRDSRVTLTDQRDALGMPQILVDWRYHQQDIHSIRKTLAVFAEEFRRDGRLALEFDPDRLESDLTRFGAYGGHHIGTARMGTDPRRSVVDTNCMVHGVDGLYIAGSAVFPTSSQANPTLHIVAMALRLSLHLKTLLGPARPSLSIPLSQGVA